MSKHISLSGLKTLLEPLVHLINKKAERPDWNENDVNSPSYIAGRTHYEEVSFVEYTVDVTNDLMGYDVPFSAFVEGETYNITWDGVEYSCVAYTTEYGFSMIGNDIIAEAGETGGNGEPFAMLVFDGMNVIFAEVASEHTIGIIDTFVHKIDEKYLPEIKLVGVAKTGSYDDLVDKVAIEYVEQDLNNEQKEIARKNIGAIDQASLDLKLGIHGLQSPSGCEFWKIFYCYDRFIAQVTDNGNSTDFSSNAIVYSLDGITWNRIGDIDIGGNVTEVCYGNGTYIVYSNKSIGYSTDFVSWSVVKNAIPFRASSICYGGDKFVVTCRTSEANTPCLAYSSDGITWTAVTLPSVYGLNKVCYGNRRFVAIADNGLAYSDDGITWTESSGIEGGYVLSEICYGDGNFVATSYQTNTICWRSTDGITWSRVSKQSGEIRSMCYYGRRFVAVGRYNIQYSDDGGKTWITVDSSSTSSHCCVGKVDSTNRILFIACGWIRQGISYGSSYYQISYDGINWTSMVISASGNDETEKVSDILSTQLVNNTVICDKMQQYVATHNTSTFAHSDLRADINEVSALVGDTSVSDQISTSISAIQPKMTTITIPAANWTGDVNPWSQVVTMSGVTANNKIDLQPTAMQIVDMQNNGVALMAENDNGTVTVYAIGSKPTVDYTMQALITEVAVV